MFYKLSILAFLLSILLIAPAYAVEGRKTPASLIKSLHEAPSIPYLSEEEKRAAFKDFESSDSVLVAKIEGVVISRMGMGVPVTRIELTGTDVYYGQEVSDGVFIYHKSPEMLQRLQSQKAIVLLKESDDRSQTLSVKQVMPADKERLNWLIEFLSTDTGADASCAEVVELACEETAI